jgi:DNA-binding transcriptional MocR family regulator
MEPWRHKLCLRAVAKLGDVITIESPAFYGTLQIIESLGMKALEIPADPRDGIILDVLAAAIRRQKLRHAYSFLTSAIPWVAACQTPTRKN